MASTLLDSFLFRSEDHSLDFKEQQYVFTKQDLPAGLPRSDEAKYLKEKKSELLKDLLAMANSWRDTPGYIVLGFREHPGKAPEVVGIDRARAHDDAHFQQFIGSKVNAPLAFSYSCHEYRGVLVGLITVPNQKRPPFYAIAAYGVVEADTVYVRRGSSTDIASPSEISQMGIQGVSHLTQADVDVAIRLFDNRPLSGANLDIRIAQFENLIERLPDYRSAQPTVRNPYPLPVDPDYLRELAHFIRRKSQAIALQAVLVNKAPSSLTNCQLHVRASQGDVQLEFLPGGKALSPPSADIVVFPESQVSVSSATTISNFGGHNTVVQSLPRLLPRQTVPTPDQFCVVPVAAGTVLLVATLYADELPSPIEYQIEFYVKGELEPWSVGRLCSYEQNE